MKGELASITSFNQITSAEVEGKERLKSEINLKYNRFFRMGLKTKETEIIVAIKVPFDNKRWKIKQKNSNFAAEIAVEQNRFGNFTEHGD